MSKAKELVFNTAIIGIGNFGTKLLSFLLLPLYTSYLSTNDYGEYDLLTTVASFLMPFITILMEESMFRFLIDCKTEKEQKNIITQTMLFICFSSLIFSIVYFIICLFIDFSYKYLFYALIISNILVAIRNAYLRGISKVKQYAAVNFISSAILIIANIVFITILHLGIKSLFLSHIVIGILSLFILIPIFRKYISAENFNKTQIKKMLKYSLPLVPNSISWAIINTSDRLIISAHIGTGANGVYSIANKFPTVVDTVYGFFYAAWKESAAKSLNDGDSTVFYNQVYSNLKKILFAIVAIILGTMPFVFKVLIKNDFLDAYPYIPILILSIFFANISGFYGGIFSAHKNTKIMGITTIIAAIINLAIDFLLVNRIGLWAAAISTLASTFFMFVYRRFAIRKYIALKENPLEIIWDGVVFTFLIANYYLVNTPFRILTIIICILYCLFINRKIFSIINFKKIRGKK